MRSSAIKQTGDGTGRPILSHHNLRSPGQPIGQYDGIGGSSSFPSPSLFSASPIEYNGLSSVVYGHAGYKQTDHDNTPHGNNTSIGNTNGTHGSPTQSSPSENHGANHTPHRSPLSVNSPSSPATFPAVLPPFGKHKEQTSHTLQNATDTNSVDFSPHQAQAPNTPPHQKNIPSPSVALNTHSTGQTSPTKPTVNTHD